MAAHAIPGVAVGVWDRGAEYVRGFGVTDVDHPVAVDGDTLFRIGSTTKTFTATTVMRLVEEGKLDLDAPVRAYLPEFTTADPTVASRVRVRQLLNHSAGWLGDFLQDFGDGEDAIASYVRGMSRLEQLTPLGEVFAYNNAAVVVAGRLIEVVTGIPYEHAVRRLVIDPLGLEHSRFFLTDFNTDVTGARMAAPHDVVAGKPVADSSLFALPRSLNPAGGLISSMRDQLRYARFHLGNGTTLGGQRLLSAASLVGMRSHPGPGGTIIVELEGVGVSWLLRPSAQGVRIVQHGGSWPGQYSGLLLVPERDFALCVFTNSQGGPKLINELVADDWALQHFAGISNLPAVPHPLSAGELSRYEGRYAAAAIGTTGAVETSEVQLGAEDGQLAMTLTEQNEIKRFRLAFYRSDYVLGFDADGQPTHTRLDFLRDSHGNINWLRRGGRLYRHHH
jgi:CubicO group peptidase (beta-lactamase class C family)